MKNSKVVSFLSPFKVGQAGNLWTLPRKNDSSIITNIAFQKIVTVSTQVMVQRFEVAPDRYNLGCVTAEVQSTYIPYSESNSRHC